MTPPRRARLAAAGMFGLVGCTLTVNVTDSPGAATCLGRCAMPAASSASSSGLFDGIRARARGDRSATPPP
jgi:hypothetical protein